MFDSWRATARLRVEYAGGVGGMHFPGLRVARLSWAILPRPLRGERQRAVRAGFGSCFPTLAASARQEWGIQISCGWMFGSLSGMRVPLRAARRARLARDERWKEGGLFSGLKATAPSQGPDRSRATADPSPRLPHADFSRHGAPDVRVLRMTPQWLLTPRGRHASVALIY